MSYLLGIFIYFYYSVIHALLSSFSASVGVINPYYLVSVFGLVYLGVFTLGIVFLSFDVRARDERERIVEVMDCRPLSNFELITGRCLGLFLVSWIPLVILCFVLQGLGWLLPQLGSPIGSTIEPVSLFGFAVLMAIPSIAFSIALVFLITLLVKNRLLSALASVGALAGMFWLMMTSSYSAVPFVDFMGVATVEFPSDIVSDISRALGWVQRLGFLFMSFAFLGFATLLHPRLDGGNRQQTGIVSGGVFVLAVALLIVNSQVESGNRKQLQEWQLAHEQKADEVIVDIISMDGNVVIEPGRSLQVELVLEFQAPVTGSISTALFTLNPGLTITEVNSANGQALNVTHSDGLLEIELESTLAPGQSTTVTLAFNGQPDNEFAYLDTKLIPENLMAANNQVLLGYQAGIFDSRFVALTPGIYWLPLSGVDIARDDTRTREKDFFELELEVELPATWTLAGPGQRVEVNSDTSNGTVSYHFSPEVDIAQVGLIASEFEKYETQINGINFEFLVYPEHTRNFEVLAPLRPEIEQILANRLTLAEDAGLKYPFSSFSLVEVPNRLRGYVGGWRMDTAMAIPGMMLMRESGFPSSRFDFNLNISATNQANGSVNNEVNLGAESINIVDLDRLSNFFINDLTGGNVFSGGARAFFADQTSATGDEAIALNYIMENLANLVFSGEQSYFSMYSDINEILENVLEGVFSGQPGQSVANTAISEITSDIELWNHALDSSLAEIDPEIDPEQTIDLLALKGGKLAMAIYDTLGVQGTGELLANIVNEHRGGSYTMADVISALAAKNLDLSVLFAEIMYSSQLPGFVVDDVELYRLPDTASGSNRYQLIVAVRNDEPVAGYARISWAMLGEGSQFFRSDSVRIDGNRAVEFGVVLSQPPVRAMLEPYLSLNRVDITAKVFPESFVVVERDLAEFSGFRNIVWDNSSDRIIADDLDPGFSVTTGGESGLRLSGQSDDDGPAIDQGLPVNDGRAPVDWIRVTSASAWGKYRHTFATIVAGDGDKKTIMPSTIPEAGLWDLEIHLPTIAPQRDAQIRGVWKLEVVSANGRELIEYDNSTATSGWNLIGQYQLPAGEVSIEVRNDGTAGAIVVDAFAWSR